MTSGSERRGFAGLSSLVSDVDAILEMAEGSPRKTKPSDSPKSTDKSEAGRGGQRSEPEPVSERRSRSNEVRPDAQQRSNTGSSGAQWFWGLVGLGALIWLLNAGLDERGESYKPSTQPSASTGTTPEATQQGAVDFSKPPVGDANVLSLPQLRWCLKEDIRLDVLRPLIASTAEAEHFNRLVTDFNSRCGSVRYREGTLERARRDVEAMRGEITNSVLRAGATQSMTKGPGAESESQKGQLGNTVGEANSPGIEDTSKTTARGSNTQKDECIYKETMTDADYAACGLTPPSSQDGGSALTSKTKGSTKSDSGSVVDVGKRLQVCREHFEANRLTTGPGGTALVCYNRVLEIDPGNTEALAGLKRIADKYEVWARGALERNRIQRARTYLNRLEAVDPNHPALAELRDIVGENDSTGGEWSTSAD